MARTWPLSLAHVTPVTFAVLLLVGTLTSAQDVPEPTLKAAFIYNFALFTEWPASVVAVAEPLAFCVIGDPAVGDALKQVVKGRLLAGRNLGVLQVTSIGPPRGCHVVYLSGVTVAQAAQLVAGVRDEPVLTMSDLEGFTDRGGIAECFFEHGKLRFRVRLESVTRARLQISSRLLALARIR
jgi:hypothetical protein